MKTKEAKDVLQSSVEDPYLTLKDFKTDITTLFEPDITNLNSISNTQVFTSITMVRYIIHI